MKQYILIPIEEIDNRIEELNNLDGINELESIKNKGEIVEIENIRESVLYESIKTLFKPLTDENDIHNSAISNCKHYLEYFEDKNYKLIK